MLNMNRFKTFLACALIGITFCTTVLAQSHRHSQRNDSTENVILEENEKTATSDAYNSGYSDGEEIRKYVDEIVKDALSTSKESVGDRDGFIKDAVDEGIIVAVIAVAGVFFGPVILVAIILFFIYKRKKQRDMVVMAAINKGVEVPEGYGGKNSSSYSGTTEQKREECSKTTGNGVADMPMMHQGIKNVAIGAGLYVMGKYIVSILCGIGIFIAIYGIGQIAISYVSGEKNSRNDNHSYTRTKDLTTTNDEKSE